MIPPVSCFECGRTLSDKYFKFKKLLEEKIKKAKEEGHTGTADNNEDICDALRIKRYCCRMHIISATYLIHLV